MASDRLQVCSIDHIVTRTQADVRSSSVRLTSARSALPPIWTGHIDRSRSDYCLFYQWDEGRKERLREDE